MKKRICVLTYKGPSCRYFGDRATCDKTIEDCLLHGNVHHFQEIEVEVPSPWDVPVAPRATKPPEGWTELQWAQLQLDWQIKGCLFDVNRAFCSMDPSWLEVALTWFPHIRQTVLHVEELLNA